MGSRKLSRGESNIAWLERHCRVPDGPTVGTPLVIADHVRKFLLLIYDTPTRTGIFSVGRKNAKTVTAALIVILHLCGPESRQNSEIYSTAMAKEQAAKVFNYAAKIIRLSPTLRGVLQIIESKKKLLCPERGTEYTALSSDAPSALGLNPCVLIHDELGQVKGPTSELYDNTETAMGVQPEPLSIIISTQAPTDSDLLSILIDDALSGADPMVKVLLYTYPIDKDPFTEKAIRAANPAFDVFMNKHEVLTAMTSAKRMPSKEPSYRNLILNQRVQATSPFMGPTLWAQNGGKPKSLHGMRIYGGLDLSAVGDLTALVLGGYDDDGVLHVHPTFWLPGETLEELAREARSPYVLWAKQGYLKTTPGRAIEYEFVAAELRDVFDEYGDDIVSIAFDRYNMKFLRPWLEKAGFDEYELEKFVEFGQGMQSMGPAVRQTEAAFLMTRVRHGMHPVLTMCCKNAVAYTDPTGGRKLVKHKSHGRIDGMVSLVMTIGVAGESVDEGDITQMLADPIIA